MNKTLGQAPIQLEGLRAPTQWFHVFKAMIDQGDVARIGPFAFTVYAVIKAHANYETGIAFPSIELISEKSGISCAQIKRELKVLEVAGYLKKSKRGRSNCYTLQEKIQVKDKNGSTQALATWPYMPSKTSAAVSDLRNAFETGVLAGMKIVNVEKLNLQINFGGLNTQVNCQSSIADLENLPITLQKKLRNKPRMGNTVIHSSE